MKHPTTSASEHLDTSAPPYLRTSALSDFHTSAPQHATALRYALITPARNEEALIEHTLQSVIAQTQLPVRWVIVSDASSDRTDEIVAAYASRYAWIELLRVENGDARGFARKAHAFNSGYATLRGVPCELVGNVDADVSFDASLFAFLVERFAADPELGVAGVPYRDDDGSSAERFANLEYVTGCCQLFRRTCLDEIGGYQPVEDGGEDWIAVTSARMKHWTTRSFVEKVCLHHRRRGSAGHSDWQRWLRRGAKDHALGNPALGVVGRSIYRCVDRPYVVGGALLLAGYAQRALQRRERLVPDELVRFHRAEQVDRAKRVALRLLTMRPRRTESPVDISIAESAARVARWVEAHDYKAYEPFDCLSSWARGLTFDRVLLERWLQQVGRQSPINLRGLLGVRPLESTKGRGFMTVGYLTMLEASGEDDYRRKAVACLEWLIANRAPGHAHYCWGNHFDYASRAGRYPAHAPIIVWTALIGDAFVSGFEQLQDERYLDVAKSVCDWILSLPRENTERGTCLSYLSDRQLSVHNANLLGAAMLVRTARHTRDGHLMDVARAAVEYSCSRQRDDGSWYYAEAPQYRWIDSFHTGYNLDSLKAYIDCTGDRSFRSHLERGVGFFRTHFVDPLGRPRYYHDRLHPIDIQSAAQTIETLAKFSDGDDEMLRAAKRVALWTIRNMQDPSGYFYYRRYPIGAAKIPMLHWGQATMYRALTLLSAKLTRRHGGTEQHRDGEVA